MSISSLLFIGSCLGCYKLGSFNARHPGRLWQSLRGLVAWLWMWIKL